MVNSTANEKILIADVTNNYTWVWAYTTWLLTRATVKMSILNYIKTSSDLPDPEGPLSKEMDSYTIHLVNEKEKPETQKSQCGECGPYVKCHCKRLDQEKSSRAWSNGYYRSPGNFRL